MYYLIEISILLVLSCILVNVITFLSQLYYLIEISILFGPFMHFGESFFSFFFITQKLTYY